MTTRPTRPTSSHRRRLAAAVATAITVPTACSRTIDEDPPPVLSETRIEPCRARCTIHLDPECGANPGDLAFRSVDECVESCAAAEPGGWGWALQEDGTDACAEEWIAAVDCLVALTCEEQHEFFTRIPAAGLDYPCQEETDVKMHCFWSTPSLDRTEDE